MHSPANESEADGTMTMRAADESERAEACEGGSASAATGGDDATSPSFAFAGRGRATAMAGRNGDATIAGEDVVPLKDPSPPGNGAGAHPEEEEMHMGAGHEMSDDSLTAVTRRNSRPAADKPGGGGSPPSRLFWRKRARTEAVLASASIAASEEGNCVRSRVYKNGKFQQIFNNINKTH